MTITPDALVGLESSTGDKKRIKLGANLQLTGNTLDTVSNSLAVYTNNTGGALALGDAVYKNATNDEIALADASVLSTAEAFGLVADASISDAASGNVATHGELVGAGSFTAGDTVYLSITGTTGNTLAAAAPSADDEVILKLGVAKNATDMHIDIKEPIEL